MTDVKRYIFDTPTERVDMVLRSDYDALAKQNERLLTERSSACQSGDAALKELSRCRARNSALAKERDDLKHDIERHVKICSEQANEIERLKRGNEVIAEGQIHEDGKIERAAHKWYWLSGYKTRAAHFDCVNPDAKRKPHANPST